MRWVKWSAKRRRKTCSTRSSASSASGSSLFLLLEDVRDALGPFVRAAGRGLDIFQQFAQVISLQAALEGDLRPQDVDFFDVNFVGKDRAGRHTDAHRADSNRRLGLESLGVADEQAFQLPGPG